MRGRRAFVVVIDALGAGALPDASAYGDPADCNTLAHLATAVGGLTLPVLGRLGLGNITPIDGVGPVAAPVRHGRLAAVGSGKDSTAGHWGLMGVPIRTPLPTYPHGFPSEVIELISEISRRGVLCNAPYNGVTVIDDYGDAQRASGDLIVYTSADSVLQIAVHEDVLAPADLYRICQQIRDALPAEHAVGRVIARPFTGESPNFTRTAGRRDFALAPPSRSYLEELQSDGVTVHTVGKTGQLMAGVGVDVQHPGSTNAISLAETGTLIDELASGMVFTNLVETDQVYGHRHDTAGFAGALATIDTAVGGWLERLGPEDLLILTADHGVDMTAPHTDHTREYAPLLAVYPGSHGRHDGILADVGASVLDWLSGRAVPELPGTSFLGHA